MAFCSETVRLSRPKRAKNHGTPAAGTNSKWSGALDGQPQGGHILQRLVVEAVELLIARLDLERRVPPLGQLATRASATRLAMQ